MKKVSVAHFVAFLSYSFIALSGITLIKQSTDNISSSYLKKGITTVDSLIPKNASMEIIANILTYSSLIAPIIGLLYWGYILKKYSQCNLSDPPLMEERAIIPEENDEDEKRTIISHISKKSSEFDYSDARNPIIIASTAPPSLAVISASVLSSESSLSRHSSASSIFHRYSYRKIECVYVIYGATVLTMGLLINVLFAYLGMNHHLIADSKNPDKAINGHYLPVNKFFEISLFFMRTVGAMVLSVPPIISIGEIIRHKCQ